MAMTEREIITLRGKTREEKIELAAKVKAEFERTLPELAAAREALIALGMMDPGFKAIRAVKTEAIDYDVRRDEPDHDDRNWRKPVNLSEETLQEIAHERAEIQSRKVGEARAARDLLDRRHSSRSRAKLLARRGVQGAGGT